MHIRYYTTLSIFANGPTFDSILPPRFPVVLLFLPEYSGFVNSEATDLFADETPPAPDETVRVRIYRRV